MSFFLGIMRYLRVVPVVAGLLAVTSAAADVLSTASPDGVEIAYEVRGEGGPTLVFIHGWSCDRSYWSAQLPYFARGHRVVAVDLAGHGESEATRSDYSMRAFGEDVAAAVDGSDPVILIGHSMGALVALEAAHLMADRVVGVVSVDSLQSVEPPVADPEAISTRLAPLESDYNAVARGFIESMFLDDADAELRERIIEDMLAGDPAVGVGAIRGMLQSDYQGALQRLDVPLALINSADYVATNLQQLMSLHRDTRLSTMSGVGHFVMMEDAPRFNELLAGTIASMAADGRKAFSVTGFSGPEAVHYDPDEDVYFVANFNGQIRGDANGFVSRVSPNGEIIDLKFMVGTARYPFHAGRGMHVADNGLWVADADGVHRFDRASGEHLEFVDLSEFDPGFPNDIVAGADGRLFVTDTGKQVIYEIANGTATIAAETPFAANGITLNPDNGRLALAAWSGADELVEWDPTTGEFMAVATLDGGGNFDGIEMIDGTVVIASQADRSLHLVIDAEDRHQVALPGEPADLGVDTRRGRLAVPYVALDRIDIFGW